MGANTTSSQAIVSAASRVLRIKSPLIKQEFDKGGLLHDLVLSYAHAFSVQISQTGACNRIHNMEERLCRWLLLTRDRIKAERLEITQEFISRMLGTQRPYITAALGLLQKKGIIRCSRGYIEILDRRSLENHSCECYAAIQEEFSLL